MTEESIDLELDESEVHQIRKQKLVELRQEGFNFPNQFRRQHLAADLLSQYQEESKESLAEKAIDVVIAGRIVLRRIIGKASFFHLQDSSGRIQVYLRANELPESYEQFKHWDLGDIVGVKGVVFKTNTGELSVHATHVELLTKSLRPLPDKFHGLSDQELRYRKRYVDLIANEASRTVFLIRSKITKVIRQFMDDNGFLEVETPMLHSIPGGAIARPFVTHHNTLDMTMYLRIAPELYLKRLIVGGFDRVYEMNRNFRNEGISTRHNPEFTMIEFYQAYADYQDLMNFTERLFHFLCDQVLGTRQVVYQEYTFDFSKPFFKMTVKEAIMHYHSDIQKGQLDSINFCQDLLKQHQITYQEKDSLGQLQMRLFEETIEQQLIQP